MTGMKWRSSLRSAVGEMAYVTHEPIDLSEWHGLARDSSEGASVEFLGTVRGQEQGYPITHLLYEAYEPMAERVIVQLIQQAQQRWVLNRVFIRHRVGRIDVGQLAVLVGVRAAHREEAFEACRFLIDTIKRDAPIWKTATGINGGVLETSCAHGDQPH